MFLSSFVSTFIVLIGRMSLRQVSIDLDIIIRVLLQLCYINSTGRLTFLVFLRATSFDWFGLLSGCLVLFSSIGFVG